MKMQKKIQTQFKDHKGWLRSADFKYNSSYYKLLDELKKQGKVEQVKRGLYKWIDDVNELNEFAYISKLYSSGVLCLFSAWAYYELADDVPSAFHIAFLHKAKPIIKPYPPIKAYFWTEKYFELGITRLDGVRIYDMERSVCDAIKFRNKIGVDTMEQVLKTYLKRKERDINKLTYYATALRIEKIATPYLKMGI